MKAFDTKNRVLETEDVVKPSTSEVINATQRVDDSTVAIRSQLAELVTVLGQSSIYYNRRDFERVVTWQDAPQSGASN
jgi:hypothetical protein